MNDEIIIYKSGDGIIKVDVLFADETVWLTIDQMAELFGKSRSTVNEHILNAYAEGELREEETKRKIGNSDFSTKPTNYYNLDVIISVGYRVKSQQGTQFRIWATQRLRDYIVIPALLPVGGFTGHQFLLLRVNLAGGAARR